MLRLYAWWAEIDVFLYEGRAADGWATCEESWGQLNRRSLLTIGLAVLLANWARARAAVALAAHVGPCDNAVLLRQAARRARRIEKLRGLPIAAAHARLIRAAIQFQTGRDAVALACLEQAETEFTNASMVLYAAAARRRRGELLSDAGLSLVESADADMAAHGVADPGRFANVYAPGFDR